MKNLSKLAVTLIAAVAGVVVLSVPVKADNAVPSQLQFLQAQMDLQKAENQKALEYIQLQTAIAAAQNRPISDAEKVKIAALQGMINGNNNLLQMGNVVMPNAYVDPYGAGNIALMDKAAYDGYVSGMALIDKIKQETWMQYTFRTH